MKYRNYKVLLSCLGLILGAACSSSQPPSVQLNQDEVLSLLTNQHDDEQSVESQINVHDGQYVNTRAVEHKLPNPQGSIELNISQANWWELAQLIASEAEVKLSAIGGLDFSTLIDLEIDNVDSLQAISLIADAAGYVAVIDLASSEVKIGLYATYLYHLPPLINSQSTQEIDIATQLLELCNQQARVSYEQTTRLLQITSNVRCLSKIHQYLYRLYKLYLSNIRLQMAVVVSEERQHKQISSILSRFSAAQSQLGIALSNALPSNSAGANQLLLKHPNFDFLLQELNELSNTQVISRPQLLLVHGASSDFFVGSNTSYLAERVQSVQDGVVINTGKTDFIKSGFSLSVYAEVLQDELVYLSLQPKLNYITEFVEYGSSDSEVFIVPNANETVGNYELVLSARKPTLINVLKEVNKNIRRTGLIFGVNADWLDSKSASDLWLVVLATVEPAAISQFRISEFIVEDL